MAFTDVFPPEISLHIFSYLNERHERWCVLGVCRAFRALGADPSLWRGHNIFANQALWMVRHHPSAQFGVCLSTTEVPNDIYEEGENQGATHSLLCDAMSDYAVAEGLRRAVVRFELYGDWAEPEVRPYWEQVVAIFGASRILTEVMLECGYRESLEAHDTNHAFTLSRLTWLPKLERATVNTLDQTPAQIGEKWPRLTSIRAHNLSSKISFYMLAENARVPPGTRCAPALQKVILEGTDNDTEVRADFFRACAGIRKFSLTQRQSDGDEEILRAIAPTLKHLVILNEFLSPAQEGVPLGSAELFVPHWPQLSLLSVYFPSQASPFRSSSGPRELQDRISLLLSSAPALHGLSLLVDHVDDGDWNLYPEAISPLLPVETLQRHASLRWVRVITILLANPETPTTRDRDTVARDILRSTTSQIWPPTRTEPGVTWAGVLDAMPRRPDGSWMRVGRCDDGDPSGGDTWHVFVLSASTHVEAVADSRSIHMDTSADVIYLRDTKIICTNMS